MQQGTFFTNTWLIGAFALLTISAVFMIACLNGGMSIEFGDLQMCFMPHEEGGLRLSLIRSA